MAEPTEHVAQFFAFDHLPPHLREVSRPFGELAAWIIATLPRNPERTKALDLLLAAKDAAVRAKLAKPVEVALPLPGHIDPCGGGPIA